MILQHLAALHHREPLQLQYRNKDVVGLFVGELGGREDRNLPLDPVIQDEVLAGQVADELDHGGDIHLVEVQHHPLAGGQRRRCEKGARQQQDAKSTVSGIVSSKASRLVILHEIMPFSGLPDIVIESHRLSIPDQIQFEPVLPLEGDERLQRLVG